MRQAAILIAAAITATFQGARAHAATQLPQGRTCRPKLLDLRWPVLAEIIDSAAVNQILGAFADSTKPLASVTLRYDGTGNVQRVSTWGVATKTDRRRLADTIRSVAHPLGNVPKGFEITVARLKGEETVSLLAATVTCLPENHMTTEALEFLRGGRPFSGGVFHRVSIGYWLAPTGTIRAAWIEETSGISRLDTLALRALAFMRHQPALVGSVPVASRVRLPFHFR